MKIVTLWLKKKKNDWNNDHDLKIEKAWFEIHFVIYLENILFSL